MTITILTLAFTVLSVSALSVALSYIDRQTQNDNNQLRDQIARMTKVLADYEERFKTLEVNGEPDHEHETEHSQKEVRADLDYNEGMSNIFSYSVSTGIRVVNADE